MISKSGYRFSEMPAFGLGPRDHAQTNIPGDVKSGSPSGDAIIKKLFDTACASDATPSWVALGDKSIAVSARRSCFKRENDEVAKSDVTFYAHIVNLPVSGRMSISSAL